MSFLAGAYTATWNGETIGQVENGFEVEEPGIGDSEMIRGDTLGPNADQDGVYQPGNYYVSCTLLDYDAAAMRAIISPNGATAGVPGTPGYLLSALAYPLILTKVAGPNALPATTRTYHKAIIAPGFPIRYLLAPRHRKVPIRFQMLPSVVSTVLRYFTDV